MNTQPGLISNIRLGWKGLEGTNTPAYLSPCGSDDDEETVYKRRHQAKLGPNVGKICLPKPGKATLTPPDTLATVVGWGRLGSRENDPHSNILQAVTIPVLADPQCQYETGLPLYSDQVYLRLS